MTAASPLVSVILATHNGQPDYLQQAINSVITQTYSNWELIIVDDASTTETARLIQSLATHEPRLRYVHNGEKLGLTKSLNKGLGLIKGDYIARLDDDDLWLDPAKLAKQVNFLQAHPEVALCGTQHTVVDETDRELFRLHFGVTDQDIRQRLLTVNQFVHSGVVIRASTLPTVGKYDERLRYAQDYELWLRIGTKFQLANLDEYLVAKRLTNQSITNQHHRQQWWSALQSAYRYRQQYPGWSQAWPVYVREGLLNIMPKAWFQTLSRWRRGRGA